MAMFKSQPILFWYFLLKSQILNRMLKSHIWNRMLKSQICITQVNTLQSKLEISVSGVFDIPYPSNQDYILHNLSSQLCICNNWYCSFLHFSPIWLNGLLFAFKTDIFSHLEKNEIQIITKFEMECWSHKFEIECWSHKFEIECWSHKYEIECWSHKFEI
jgi:hypothetical protein